MSSYATLNSNNRRYIAYSRVRYYGGKVNRIKSFGRYTAAPAAVVR